MWEMMQETAHGRGEVIEGCIIWMGGHHGPLRLSHSTHSGSSRGGTSAPSTMGQGGRCFQIPDMWNLHADPEEALSQDAGTAVGSWVICTDVRGQ